MYIKRSDAINLISNCQKNLSNISSLDQKERNFVLTAIKVANSGGLDAKFGKLEDEFNKTVSTMTGLASTKSSDEFYELENRVVKKLNSSKPKHSNFVLSFFKGIGNKFFGRISSQKIITELNNVKVKPERSDLLDARDF